jgi:hypothetical protein
MKHVTTALLGSLVACGAGGSKPQGAALSGSDLTSASGMAGANSRSGDGVSSGAADSGSLGTSASGGSGLSGGAGAASSGASGSNAGGVSGGPASSGTASSGTASSGTASSGGAVSTASIWTPPSASPIHFHWQLSTTFSTSDLLAGQQGLVAYDIDGEGATAADVAAIHASGAKAVCYVDVGTLERGRSDYDQFPASVVGPAVAGWPGENWLLVTSANQSVILPLMKARLATWCQSKGFDAVEPDNLDGWTNIMMVMQEDNIAYDLAIAGLAHGLSLSVGLKNTLSDADASYVPNLTSRFDWALVEQCYEFSECSSYAKFTSAGKAVWDVEYNVSPNCVQADGASMNAQLRDLDLAGPHAAGYEYTPCVPDSQATW